MPGTWRVGRPVSYMYMPNRAVGPEVAPGQVIVLTQQFDN